MLMSTASKPTKKAAVYGILSQPGEKVPAMVLLKPIGLSRQKPINKIPIDDDPDWILPGFITTDL
jgi:hypothetical protein